MSDTSPWAPPSPLAAYTSGLAIGQGLVKQQQAQAAAEAARKRQEQIDAVLRSLQSPNATYDDYLKASMLMPKDQADAIQKAASAMKVEEQQAVLTDSSHIFAAITAGKTDVAAQLLQQQADATRASGNEQGAGFADVLAKLVGQGPEGAQAVKTLIGYQMAVLPGGKDAFDALNKLNADERINNAVSLEQQLADLEHTRADTIRLLAEAKGKDKLTPEQIIAEEDNLRTELYKNNTMFRTIDFNYDVIKNAQKTGIGDVGLIFAIMKMYDPISVVREGEQATAQNSAGVPASIIGVYNNLVGGGKMADTTRAQILSQASKVWDSAKATADKNTELIRDIARRRGLNVDNVMQQDKLPQPQQPTTPSGFSVTAPNGKTYTFKTQADLDAFKKDAGL